ncbi:MAG: hypothetical protein GQ564_09130 [Bacteroidales bacterium]|nr:hypothetical protein [Bacteroidales bacterium]
MSNLSNRNNEKSLVNTDDVAQEIGNKKIDAQHILSKKVGMLQRIFPSVEQKLAVAHSKEILEQESKSDVEVRRMHNEFFKQALQITFDKVLTEGAESVQMDLTTKFTENKFNLDKKVVQMTVEYFDEIEKLEEKAFETKSENIKTRRLRMLNERMDEFERTVSSLMKKYEDTHNKSVGKKNF